MIQTGSVNRPLRAGYGSWYEDIALGTPTAGVHTLTLTVDSTNTVAESDETNNVYTRRFFVAQNYNGDIHGFKWNDLNGNGTRDAGEPGLAGWTIYLDANNNGQFDPGSESSDITDASGAYDLLNVPAGLHNVREVAQTNWQQTSPGPAGLSNNDFQITVAFIDSSLTASQQAVFETAASRWAQVIMGDVPDLYNVGFFIDDLMIDASAIPIDGVNNILGWSGPTVLRAGSYLPAQGMMQFDTADLANMESNGSLSDVILHEMGHVLGLGTIWSDLGLLTGAGTTNPQFTGASATAEYNQIFGLTSTSVPVENTGGSGTRDSHWRESVFDNELMTGWLNGSTRPLSRVTAGSMQDLGYTVNLDAADPFAAPGSAALQASAAVSGEFLGLPNPPAIIGTSVYSPSFARLSTLVSSYNYEVHVDAGQSVTNINFGDQLVDATAPVINGVYVRGSDWSAGFLSYLGTSGLGSSDLGYAIPVGSGAQLNPLPWSNINEISIAFNEDVLVQKNDLLLSGINVSSYDVASSTFVYDPAIFTATWTMAAPLANDRLSLALNADGPGPITDLAGNALDGEWLNPATTTSTSSDTWPSGNGAAGGNFTFLFNVLPGDINHDGLVNGVDLSLQGSNWQTSVPGSRWRPERRRDG